MSDACATNCSFISGEGSSAIWLLTFAVLLPPRWRPLGLKILLGFADRLLAEPHRLRRAFPFRRPDRLVDQPRDLRPALSPALRAAAAGPQRGNPRRLGGPRRRRPPPAVLPPPRPDACRPLGRRPISPRHDPFPEPFHVQDQQGRPCLFGRPRHLDHPEVVADHLRGRGRYLHRRSRAGRGTRAGAQEGRDDGDQGDSHRGSARGIRPRFRLPDVPHERALRGRVPARHLDRAAADRQAAGRDRRKKPAPTPSPTARPARATTRCASNSPPMRSIPTSR